MINLCSEEYLTFKKYTGNGMVCNLKTLAYSRKILFCRVVRELWIELLRLTIDEFWSYLLIQHKFINIATQLKNFLTKFTFLGLWINLLSRHFLPNSAAIISTSWTLDPLDITTQLVNKLPLILCCGIRQRIEPQFYLQSDVCFQLDLEFIKKVFNSLLTKLRTEQDSYLVEKICLIW